MVSEKVYWERTWLIIVGIVNAERSSRWQFDIPNRPVKSSNEQRASVSKFYNMGVDCYASTLSSTGEALLLCCLVFVERMD